MNALHALFAVKAGTSALTKAATGDLKAAGDEIVNTGLAGVLAAAAGQLPQTSLTPKGVDFRAAFLAGTKKS